MPFTLGFDFAQSLFLVSTSLNQSIESQFNNLSPTPEKKFALRKFFKRFRFAEVTTVAPFVGGLSRFIGITHNVDPFRKHCLIEGLDDIGLTLQKSSKISDFENNNKQITPWLHK